MTSNEGTEAGLGLLINLTGKLRMLSHRTVMFALYSAVSTTSSRDCKAKYEQSIAEFSEVIALITKGSLERGIGPDVLNALSNANAIKPEHIDHLETFLSLAKRIHTVSGNENSLAEFTNFVSNDLLATLNAINDGVRRALDMIIATRLKRDSATREVIAESILKLEEISHTVRMVALNATIEAARAGTSGLGFAVIAKEIRELSDNATSSVREVKSQLENL